VRPRVAWLLGGLGVFILIGWGAGALWTSVVGAGDLHAVEEVVAQRSPALNSVIRVVTWAGSVWLLIPLALVCCVLMLRRGLGREAAAVAVSLGGAMLISALVKLLVSRPRPPVEHLQAVTGPSFPSGHATQASAFWLSLVFAMRAAGARPRLVRLAGAAAGVLVAAVAFSRVYLGVHYPSDVVAGVLLGAGWASYTAFCIEGESLGSRSGE